ncbi:anthranilate synthase [Mesorhizobium sp. M2D.F.Ca.ET.185.01.1.1]|uniref:anthranilate synthase n=1 Tax=unclassified Mesorhizobium TaxID=325217 RepID=UPI000FCAE884|nr:MULTISPECIES: anthranilate synthase [unclassified Mesorhizobium]TGP82501.1 anthranilate synthase [bacterium M00.F.Ca.ET.227.01.1.1]TGP94256.1 anthranilate synthase [bacterium M00.F.Ca.ET.221.01.1.1]TGP97711.1 anthranilate synthase [bacterium M00.F.Ca.ET.222.01.1.1]TGU11978.1 anthranilate synthase [bacterium M00.F.Ca.ET.163.01.1.1]TGU35767.1 anthranilate synthase [bacterium M00.F.Ca.ET.156.01.1.1]TGU48692.1 anthranilate synthase [bacterium M00.F.Ca.ET.146.01.1.1]TGV70495.1 anthranilate syn
MTTKVLDNGAERFVTAGGVTITRERHDRPYEGAIDAYVDGLNSRRGAVFSSNYEYPGRYTRWDTAIIDPPLVISARGRAMRIEALNMRGEVLLPVIGKALAALGDVTIAEASKTLIRLDIAKPGRVFTEEERSRVPSVFTVLRAITALFKTAEDANLGLYGAFGYDLAFQFDPVDYKLERKPSQRDLVLFLPDEILVVDHYSTKAWTDRYDYSGDGFSTEGLAREAHAEPFKTADRIPPRGDHEPGEYANLVRRAMESFKRGDLFEVVPGQMFYERCETQPSDISRKLKSINPSPYSFFINLGENEYLIGASPEMFVRVNGRRVETCPISGTIKRGDDAISDSEQILKLLNSKKDESELTMCSDVDRNDKSRVCEPGSVRVIGRRQIEMYSRLIHTVDHIEGRLREGMDAFDAFLSHAWAVTVTGAPKLWAMRFIEQNEKSPRAWYGGAIGMVNFNGDMNTGLTLRTIRIKDGIAEVRAGATLLFDSVPEEEEAETELKASAMLSAIRDAKTGNATGTERTTARVGDGVNILLVDHEDSFVHTLANYFRQTGANVSTVRTPVPEEVFERLKPDLVVLSPGPGTPKDFDCAATIKRARARDLPIFGVCLGLQALAEAYGGELRQLHIPMHGKPSRIRVSKPGIIFSGLPKEVTVGRYHSIFADPVRLPDGFVVTAETEDGIIMAFEHRKEPIAAVQFHPESIMTLGHNAGMRIIENIVAHLPRKAKEKAA